MSIRNSSILIFKRLIYVPVLCTSFSGGLPAASGAVASALSGMHFAFYKNVIFSVNNGFVTFDPGLPDNHYYGFVQQVYHVSNLLYGQYTCQSYTGNAMYIYVRDGNGNVIPNNTEVCLDIMIVY